MASQGLTGCPRWDSNTGTVSTGIPVPAPARTTYEDMAGRVEARKNIISVYWKERGGFVELAKVIDFLKDCAAVPDSLEDGSSASDEGR